MYGTLYEFSASARRELDRSRQRQAPAGAVERREAKSEVARSAQRSRSPLSGFAGQTRPHGAAVLHLADTCTLDRGALRLQARCRDTAFGCWHPPAWPEPHRSRGAAVAPQGLQEGKRPSVRDISSTRSIVLSGAPRLDDLANS